MTKIELLQWLQDKPDAMEIKFSSEGYTYEVGTAMAVPEWNTIYLGIDNEELTESLAEETAIEMDEDDDLPFDRDAVNEAQETSENDACCAVEGGRAGIVVRRHDIDDSTGVM